MTSLREEINVLKTTIIENHDDIMRLQRTEQLSHASNRANPISRPNFIQGPSLPPDVHNPGDSNRAPRARPWQFTSSDTELSESDKEFDDSWVTLVNSMPIIYPGAHQC